MKYDDDENKMNNDDINIKCYNKYNNNYESIKLRIDLYNNNNNKIIKS
jgi:hypothetical protein